MVRWSEIFRSGDPTERDVARALLERDDIRVWLDGRAVRVRERDVVRAVEILARWPPFRQRGDDQPEVRALPRPIAFTTRGTWILPVLGVVLIVALHAVAGDWWRDARFSTRSVLEGEVWRLLTSVFLHRDNVHLASNSGAMIVLGWALAGRIGNGRAALAFVLTGALGSAICLLRHAGHSHVGASGAIFGLLGMLVSLRIDDLRQGAVLMRREVLRLGGFVALALLSGVGPRTDWLAHAGGFAGGLLVQSLIRRRDGTGSGLLAAALLLASWLPVLLRAWGR